MKLALGHKTANAALLLAPIVVALLAAAAARAAEAEPTVMIAAVDPNATEAGHAAIFLATRDGPSIAQPLVVPIQLGGTAKVGADYVSPGASITFPAQVAMVMVQIKPVADALVEGAETVVVSLAPKPGTYNLGDSTSATASIADASAAAGTPGNSAPGKPPVDPVPNQPKPAHTGTLNVEIVLNGEGRWMHPRNGAYSDMKFRRTMSFTVPLDGVIGGGSQFTQVDRREEKTQPLMFNFYRYLALAPHALMTNQVNVPCGKGEIHILDEYSGKEVGDPGQPPLVPYTETHKGGGVYPSGDATVPERDLCLTRVTIDGDKHVIHILIDGSDTHIKTHITHNGLEPGRPINVLFQGDELNGPVKPKLTFIDLPIPAGAQDFQFSRTFPDFSQVDGRGGSKVKMRADVKVRASWN